MFRTIIPAIIILSLAIGGGSASVWYAINTFGGLGAVRLGVWVAFPLAGTPQSDPYTRARIARDAELPLGAAEGLSFTARSDSTGAPLKRQCTYRIEGSMPVARFWTLFAGNNHVLPLVSHSWAPAGLHSRKVIYKPAGSVEIAIGPHAQPGNWLPVHGKGPLVLVLSLYDTPIASSSSISEVELPQVLRTMCDE